MELTIVRPQNAHTAYQIATETFATLTEAVAGIRPRILTDREPLPADGSPLVVIGSDVVNHFVADLYFDRKIDGFSIRCGTDDYAIRSQKIDERDVLFLAGGRPRAAIYAVYRYFEKFCGCRYFLDGDRIEHGSLPLENIELIESPRFEYRGLRYFAHRSLHRFQAEHWSLADWQSEIDWILKKRLNLFMLRIGMDDLFQKAFPDIVPYPERDEKLPEAGSGYNDRTLFWSLEYRGELRKKLLAYAFERDLMHPEDCGTMTHWYSRTPLAYLQKVDPAVLSKQVFGYSDKTELVWDIRKDENLENYFKLTDTHIREYGRPELFHTIGLAERSFSEDREVNMRLKLNVYRRISSYIAEKYPTAKLFLASWDLWMFYTPEEVQRLVAELDPSRTILLDYTSDTTRDSNFTNWGVVGAFPWIFGIFSGYEANSEIRGYYTLTNERLKLAKADRFCKGLILWPELSHGDTFMTEYLSENAWEGETREIPEMLETFCRDRYPADSRESMLAIWQAFLPIAELRAWSMTKELWQSGLDVFVHIRGRAKFQRDPVIEKGYTAAEAAEHQLRAVQVLRGLASMPREDTMQRRDLFDIARTVLGRYIDFGIKLCEKLFAEKDPYLLEAMPRTLGLMSCLAELLHCHEDYSLYETLERMRSVTETNPHFEATLKQNAESTYCRSYIYENAKYLYLPEMEILFHAVEHAFLTEAELAEPGLDYQEIDPKLRENRTAFFDTPLSEMDKAPRGDVAEILATAADNIEKLHF